MGKSFTDFAKNVSINTKIMVGNLQLCNHAESVFFKEEEEKEKKRGEGGI